MADPLKEMCDKLGVSTEEALFYLEGFRWDLNAATEACRSKTLPSPSSLTAQPPSSVNERTAEEEQSREEKIENFLEVAIGSSVADAVKYLSANNWSMLHAAASFYDHRYDQPEKKSKPMMPSSHDGSDLVQDVLSNVPQFRSDTSTSVRIGSPPSSSKSRSGIATAEVVKNFSGMAGVDQDSSTEPPPLVASSQVEGSSSPTETKPWYMSGFSGDGRSDLVQDVLSKVPQFHDTSSSLRIGSPPLSASTPPLELTPESIKQLSDNIPEASSKALIDCLNNCKGNVADAFLYYHDYSKKYPAESLRDDVKEQRLASFASATGHTIQVARVYLEKNQWKLEGAMNDFLDHDSKEQTSALNMGLMENRDPPLSSMELLPSQSQFESSYVSSGPTETQRSLEKGGEGDVTVAIPGMAKAQVDGKAAEEGSSTETVPVPFANRDSTTVETQAAPRTITITITLPETSLELPFRSNQTVRDIRNAIDQRYPDNDRGYVLQSGDDYDYMDWNTTVDRVSIRGTILFQLYP